MSIKKVLEIGVGFGELTLNRKSRLKGASLYMWRDFFPNAQIYGADILPKLVFKNERIETFQCDQSKKADLKKLLKKTGTDIDLFVDDGSHRSGDQVSTCLTLMPLLQKKVIYIIEDVRVLNHTQHLKIYDYQVFNFNRRGHHNNRLILVQHKKTGSYEN